MVGEALNTIFAIIGWSLLGICLMLGCYAFILIAASIGAKGGATDAKLAGGGKRRNSAPVAGEIAPHGEGA